MREHRISSSTNDATKFWLFSYGPKKRYEKRLLQVKTQDSQLTFSKKKFEGNRSKIYLLDLI
jgi:hypothetical protein